MMTVKNIFLTITTFLVVLNASCMKRKEDSFLFPFSNSMIAFRFAANRIETETEIETEQYWSKNFYLDERYIYMAELEGDSITRYDRSRNRFKTIRLSDYSKVFFTDQYVLTVSQEYHGLYGFRFSVYSFDPGGGKINVPAVAETDLHLFVTDAECWDGAFYLAGSDELSLSNVLYRFDIQSGQAEKIVAFRKQRDSIKTVVLPDAFIFYLSVAKVVGEDMMVYGLQSNGGLFSAEVSTGTSEIYQFSGKGFSIDERLFLPLIDTENRNALIEADLNGNVLNYWKMETGVYETIIPENGTMWLTGYNYELNMSAFYLIRFEPDRIPGFEMVEIDTK